MWELSKCGELGATYFGAFVSVTFLAISLGVCFRTIAYSWPERESGTAFARDGSPGHGSQVGDCRSGGPSGSVRKREAFRRLAGNRSSTRGAGMGRNESPPAS